MHGLADSFVKPLGRALRYGLRYRRALAVAEAYTGAAREPLSASAVFVIGCGRSGTSLMGRLVGLHPGVVYLREPYHLWAAVDPRTDASGLYVEGMCRCILDLNDVSEAVRRRFGALFLIPVDAGSVLLVEKTPINAMRIGYLEGLVAEPRFVHIVRDGCDVVRSITFLARDNRYRIAGRRGFNQWWGIDDAKWRHLVRDAREVGYLPDEVDLYATHEERAAYEWIVSLGEIDRYRSSLGPRITDIRYAGLIGHPATTLREVARLLDLPATEDWIDAATRAVHPARVASPPGLLLPPRTCDAFNEAQERFGFQGRATPKG